MTDQKLLIMNQQSWLCSVCSEHQASSFCANCQSRDGTFLCSDCVKSHIVKIPNVRGHNILPISAYGQHTIPGYFDRLAVRTANVPLGSTELFETLREVDACIAEFTSKMESTIYAIWEYAHATVAKLKQLRADFERDINLAIEEVTSTIDQDNPELRHEFSRALRDFEPNNYSLKMFSYKVDERPFPPSFDNILWFAQGLDAGERYIPSLERGSLILHNLLGGQTKIIHFTGQLSNNDVLIMNGQAVIILDGYSELREVFSLDLKTAKLTQLQSMSDYRNHPGVHKYRDYIYVFGGVSGDSILSSCEKLNLQTKTWSSLPNMHSNKCDFTPCFYESNIYLPCVSSPQQRLEVFNVHTEKFKVLPIPLPPSFADCASTVSFIVDGELIVLFESQIGRCHLKTESAFQLTNIEGTETVPHGSVNPVRIGRKVYCFGTIFLHFDLDTNAIVNTNK